MKIRKYRAPTMREALAEAKRELGADALIVSTREVRRGVLGTEIEVTAAIDDGLEEPSTPMPSAAAYGPRAHALPPPVGTAVPAPVAATASGPVRGPSLDEADVERVIGPLRAELRSLRSLLRPLGEMHGELSELRNRIDPERAELRESAAAVRVAPSEKRVVVIVGPTGVGKTTTIAKLAARAALVERRRVALISLDDYRIGGSDQVRTYAELIGIPVRLLDDPARLRATIDELRDCDRIFVDTAGRSPRDREASWALARAITGQRDMEVHLAISASTSPEVTDEIARRHRPLGPTRLLFTKLDEAPRLTEIGRAPARLGMPVTWLTTGQRVPEDLEQPSLERLMALASGAVALEEVAA